MNFNFSSGRVGGQTLLPPNLKSPIYRPERNLLIQCQEKESACCLWSVAKEKSGRSSLSLCIQNLIVFFVFFNNCEISKPCLISVDTSVSLTNDMCQECPAASSARRILEGHVCALPWRVRRYRCCCWLILQSTQPQVLGWKASWTSTTHWKSKRLHKTSKTQSRCS